jgi:hypothetical protein
MEEYEGRTSRPKKTCDAVYVEGRENVGAVQG